ncbi:hypothetical protein [Calidifontibacter terrae]
MVWSRVRGAPRGLPVDRTDLLGATIDLQARVAWLLRVNRIASPYGALPAEAFNARLAEVGGRARHTSAISTAESGRAAIDLELVAAYERALGRAHGQLTGAVSDIVLAQRANAQWATPSREEAYRGLSRLQETVDHGAATGTDWIALAGFVTAANASPPPESLVRRWSHQLTIEMLRSGYFDYSCRWTALALLLSDPLLAPPVEEEIIAVASTPGAPYTRNAWDVLTESRQRLRVGQLICGLTVDDPERTLGLSLGLATMIGRGQLGRDDVAALVRQLYELSSYGSENDRALAWMLAARLGQTASRTIGAPVVPAPERHVMISAPPMLEAYVNAAREESGLAEDDMIVRLLKESLSHLLLERRQMAHLMISASPYRDSIARVAVAISTTHPDKEARASASVLLRQVRPDDRSLLLDLVRSSDPDVVTHGLTACARTGQQIPRALRDQLLEQPQTRAVTLNALGLMGDLDDRSPDAILVTDWHRRFGHAIRTDPS